MWMVGRRMCRLEIDRAAGKQYRTHHIHTQHHTETRVNEARTEKVRGKRKKRLNSIQNLPNDYFRNVRDFYEGRK